MKQILAFNISNDIKKIFTVLNIELIEVSKEEQIQTLEYLITKKINLKNNLPFVNGFEEPLLIFHNFDEDSFENILHILSVNGCGNVLKAVVTDTNIHWPAILLYNELIKEREAISRRH